MEPWWTIIRARVEQRAVELGRSVRSLLIDAGVTVDILYRPRVSSPKLATLQKIAGAAGLTLPQLMGFEAHGRLPRDIVAFALRTVATALPNLVASDDAFIDATQAAINILMQHRREGRAIDAEALSLLETTIAEIWAGAGSQQSEATPQHAAAPAPDAPSEAPAPPTKRSPRRSKA